MKSLTGRTEVVATVGDKGEVDIKVLRGATTIHSFSVGRESGLGARDTIEVAGKVATVYDNDGLDGPRVKEVISIE